MGGGDFGGGGFLNDAPGSSGKGAKGAKSNATITPCSVAQLLKASHDDDAFKLDDHELFIVKIVGFIENVDDKTTHVKYFINDGTGSFECQQWFGDASDSANKMTYKNYDFVKVIGVLKIYSGTKHLAIYDIQKVRDLNEATFHLLETITVHLFNTRGPIPGSAMDKSGASAGVFRGIAHGTPQGARLASSAQQGNSTMKDAVLKALQATTNADQGMHLDEVARFLKGQGIGIGRDEVQRQIELLSNDGLCYSTIDEEHYLPSVL